MHEIEPAYTILTIMSDHHPNTIDGSDSSTDETFGAWLRSPPGTPPRERVVGEEDGGATTARGEEAAKALTANTTSCSSPPDDDTGGFFDRTFDTANISIDCRIFVVSTSLL